jgi:hypothetical protein
VRVSGLVREGCAFYIGITECPSRRWEEHSAGGHWREMVVLLEAPASSTTAALERQLIERFGVLLECHNASRGGERASGDSSAGESFSASSQKVCRVDYLCRMC